MPVDITQIPLQELLEDRAASEADAIACERIDPVHFMARIRVNRDIVAKINAELERRERLAAERRDA